MWVNHYYLEARRLAAERTAEGDRAALARLAACYRDAQRAGSGEASPLSNSLRRTAARLALAVGKAALRVARSLDERTAADSGASPVSTG